VKIVCGEMAFHEPYLLPSIAAAGRK
jgi:hypothetical protein